ncbi:hypothetical protein [Sulfurimonas indica]|uniref:hypothetical protein n=1 Tax=Sulfurimonas TaxID=202746 RepID=UPI001262ED7D|nr:hypothetical protein [Sulfurimonas indica]
MKKRTKCIEYQIYEANVLVSLSLFVADSISRIEKKYTRNKINATQYIAIRKKYIELISEFKNNLEGIEQ